MERIIFTKKTADFLLKEALKGRESLEISLNLGQSKSKVKIIDGFIEANNQKFKLEELEKLKDNTLYTIENKKVLAVELFSKETNLYYKLRPTKDWPTLMLSSVPMHRFITVTPKNGAELMVKSVGKISGHVLDTCGGLGYTAITSVKLGATSVDSFEKDENVLEIAKYNPFSLEYFENKKITINKKDIFEGIKEINNEIYDIIIHDPPTPTFAKALYFKEFYSELFRVLKKGGKMYHYSPNPGKTKGKEFWNTIIRNLVEVGFRDVKYNNRASGVTAEKPLN